MTLKELYASIQGDYDQATRVMRMEKLIDKHIRKLEGNGAVQKLLDAGAVMDGNGIFETAHAIKGVCGNLGLVKLSEAASALTEEFRPGHAREMSDDEVKERLDQVAALYKLTLDGIHKYTEG